MLLMYFSLHNMNGELPAPDTDWRKIIAIVTGILPYVPAWFYRDFK